MAQRKSKAGASFDAEQVKRELLEQLEREGAVKLGAIKPKGAQESVLAALAQLGWDVTPKWVRRPLAAQLDEALAHGAMVPVKSLASHVRGASGAELKLLIASAVRQGTAHKLLRGNAEVLAGASGKVLSRQQLLELRAQVEALSKLLGKVSKARDLTLSTEDVAQALSSASAAIERTTPAPAAEKSALVPTENEEPRLGALLDAVEAVRDEKTGLSFVPRVVWKLSPPLAASSVLGLLLDAASRELLELRPEGGIGRLSEAELSVCPRGPHGTRLSWARLIEGAAR